MMNDGKTPLPQQSEGKIETFGSPTQLQVFAAVAIFTFIGTLLFYGFIYSLHQDLAGGTLSGRLAVTLGEAFSDYSVYFPAVEKFWFSTAAHLSKLSGLRLDLTVVVMTNLMALFGVGLACYVRRITVGCSTLFLITSASILIILPIIFKNVFGLREHLVVLGLWPYLVLRFSDPEMTIVSPRLRIIIGLWMGMTLLFKYLYSIVVILVECTDALIQRKLLLLFRAENILAGLIVFLYLFIWLGLDPAQREVIGIMLNSIDANLASPTKNLFKLVEHIIPAVFLFVASFYCRVPKRLFALAVAVAAATLFAAWSQERWYSHHLFPITMAYIMWWWISAKQFRWYINLVLALIIVMPIGNQLLKTRKYQKQNAELVRVLDEKELSVAGKRVAILTMHPSPYNQYLASHDALRWNPMMNNAYVSSELKPFDKKGVTGTPPPIVLDSSGSKMLHDQMLRLWEDMPPDVLILDHSDSWPLDHIEVDWLHIFSKDNRFQAFISNYRPILTHEGPHITFTYYVRAH
ncbi:MAG: hypothetical protein ABJO01_08590 [Parasphingorhabdus sp.]|uniref:hypothetical protein n=1 Tax=Parasphingorhabdus sp. TaxID=2709688 RepID=UPI0032997446